MNLYRCDGLQFRFPGLIDCDSSGTATGSTYEHTVESFREDLLRVIGKLLAPLVTVATDQSPLDPFGDSCRVAGERLA